MANNILFDGDAYWNDSWVQELDGDEERLYHFYITSPHLHKSGVYKETERSVEFYVHGLGAEKIRSITEKFAAAKKVIRCGEWIIVPTTLKHQKYIDNRNVIASIVEYLKKIPDEVFEVLRNCSYPIDLNAIKPPQKAENPSPSPTPGENLTQLNSTELNSTAAHFLRLWQQNADVFNFLSGLKRPKDWKAFWEKCSLTVEQIDTAVGNFLTAVKSGAIERRFVPSSPDNFVLNGWLQKSLEPYKKTTEGKERGIANDKISDDFDISEYFTE
ncbi:MAG: hypothetical protein MdMp014T_0243 [Treponematales bacterium]